MKTKRFLKWIAASLTTLMLVLGLGFTALAYVSIDNSRETSLTVQFEKEGTGFANVQFRIYRVAEVSDMAEFTLTGDFAGYPVSLEDLDSSGWRALAQTLDAYVGRDSLAPLKTAVTDAAGKVIADGTSKLMVLQGKQSVSQAVQAMKAPALPPKYIEL